MEYKIENNVPMPRVRLNVAMRSELGLTAMKLEVGQSFLVNDRPMPSVRSMMSSFGKKFGKRFACRRVDGGVRVWGVE